MLGTGAAYAADGNESDRKRAGKSSSAPTQPVDAPEAQPATEKDAKAADTGSTTGYEDRSTTEAIRPAKGERAQRTTGAAETVGSGDTPAATSVSQAGQLARHPQTRANATADVEPAVPPASADSRVHGEQVYDVKVDDGALKVHMLRERIGVTADRWYPGYLLETADAATNERFTERVENSLRWLEANAEGRKLLESLSRTRTLGEAAGEARAVYRGPDGEILPINVLFHRGLPADEKQWPTRLQEMIDALQDTPEEVEGFKEQHRSALQAFPENRRAAADGWGSAGRIQLTDEPVVSFDFAPDGKRLASDEALVIGHELKHTADYLAGELDESKVTVDIEYRTPKGVRKTGKVTVSAAELHAVGAEGLLAQYADSLHVKGNKTLAVVRKGAEGDRVLESALGDLRAALQTTQDEREIGRIVERMREIGAIQVEREQLRKVTENTVRSAAGLSTRDAYNLPDDFYAHPGRVRGTDEGTVKVADLKESTQPMSERVKDADHLWEDAGRKKPGFFASCKSRFGLSGYCSGDFDGPEPSKEVTDRIKANQAALEGLSEEARIRLVYGGAKEVESAQEFVVWAEEDVNRRAVGALKQVSFSADGGAEGLGVGLERLQGAWKKVRASVASLGDTAGELGEKVAQAGEVLEQVLASGVTPGGAHEAAAALMGVAGVARPRTSLKGLGEAVRGVAAGLDGKAAQVAGSVAARDMGLAASHWITGHLDRTGVEDLVTSLDDAVAHLSGHITGQQFEGLQRLEQGLRDVVGNVLDPVLTVGEEWRLASLLRDGLDQMLKLAPGVAGSRATVEQLTALRSVLDHPAGGSSTALPEALDDMRQLVRETVRARLGTDPAEVVLADVLNRLRVNRLLPSSMDRAFTTSVALNASRELAKVSAQDIGKSLAKGVTALGKAAGSSFKSALIPDNPLDVASLMVAQEGIFDAIEQGVSFKDFMKGMWDGLVDVVENGGRLTAWTNSQLGEPARWDAVGAQPVRKTLLFLTGVLDFIGVDDLLHLKEGFQDEVERTEEAHRLEAGSRTWQVPQEY
ncbi:hypothetical protein ACWCZ5_33605 [Streptomyces sp. NPDC001667]